MVERVKNIYRRIKAGMEADLMELEVNKDDPFIILSIQRRLHCMQIIEQEFPEIDFSKVKTIEYLTKEK